MFRFIFYLAFGYIIMKMLRVFIDPLFEGNKIPKPPATENLNAKTQAKHSQGKTTLGEYVEFEEVKN